MKRPFHRHAVAGTVAALGLITLSTACNDPDWVGASDTDSVEPASAAKSAGSEGESDDECSDDADEGASGDADEGASGGSGGSGGAACCEDKLPGKAHCVAESEIPSSTRSSLNKCDSGGLCVPDSLRSGNAPKSCNSDFGPGVCVSTCVKAIAEQSSLLKQQTCASGELCAPCIHPIKKEPTGACELGKSSKKTLATAAKKPCAKKSGGAATDKPSGSEAPAKGDEAPAKGEAPSKEGDDKPATTPAAGGCCGGKGICVTPTQAGDQADHLEAKECEGDKLCAPVENANPAFKPKRCTGKALTGSYTGVCLSTCINFGLLETFISDQGSCDSDHRCLPCKTPIGTATGAPGCE